MKFDTDKIRELVAFSVSDKTTVNKFVVIEKINIIEAEKIKKRTGLNLNGYERILDKSSIRHVIKKHATQKEYERGLVPVLFEDFELIPKIAKPENIIYTSRTKDNKDAILYQFEDENVFFYLEEVRTGRKQVVLKTMYKKSIKKRENTRLFSFF